MISSSSFSPVGMETESSSPRTTHRWYQFTLRGMFVFVTLLAIIVTSLMYYQTGPRQTGRELDLQIVGKGYFQLVDGNNGGFVNTRDGHFGINSNGQLIHKHSGCLLDPPITIPPDFLSIHVESDGGVYVAQPGNSTRSIVGQIQLATFVNLEGVREVQPGIFHATDASGLPSVSNPDTNGTGVIRQGWLDESPAISRLSKTDMLLGLLCILVAWMLIELRQLRHAITEQQQTITSHRTKSNTSENFPQDFS